MLVQFTVENFKSIREEQTLSMVASNYDKDHPENVIDLDQIRKGGVKGLKGVKLLKSAVIYGANASGKSNILEAMDFLNTFIGISATKLNLGDEIFVEPFLLSDTTKNQPSYFEIHFIHNDILYKYGLAVTRKRVVEEWLYEYRSKTPRKVFTRELNGDVYLYEYGSTVKPKQYLEGKTRDNALFLSVGAQFNEADLKIVYEWNKGFFLSITHAPDWVTIDQILVQKELEFEDQIKDLLKKADFGISDFIVRELNFDEISAIKDIPEEVKKQIREGKEKASVVETKFLHSGDNDRLFSLEFDQESAGTIRYFELIGPWLHVLKQGALGFIDEIEKSMHPNLSRWLISMFHNPKWNSNNAQLIMTTHDATLLYGGLFRRDQIWITEKSKQGETVLYPLLEYKVKSKESLIKGYLAGRYGGVPFIDDED